MLVGIEDRKDSLFRVGVLRRIDEVAEALRWVDGCTRGIDTIDQRDIRGDDPDLLWSGIGLHQPDDLIVGRVRGSLRRMDDNDRR